MSNQTNTYCITDKIRNAFLFCDYCMSNTHKLKNCDCENFIDLEKLCNYMRHILNLNYENFKTWLLNYYYEQKQEKLLYYFALAKCNLNNRINKTNYLKIIEKIANAFYNKTDTLLPDFIAFDYKKTSIKIDLLPIIKNDYYECPICLQNIQNIHMVKLGCNHNFCNSCIYKYLDRKIEICVCPLCRSQIKYGTLIS